MFYSNINPVVWSIAALSEKIIIQTSQRNSIQLYLPEQLSLRWKINQREGVFGFSGQWTITKNILLVLSSCPQILGIPR